MRMTLSDTAPGDQSYTVKRLYIVFLCLCGAAASAWTYNPADYDRLDGRVARGNLYRNGVFPVRGLRKDVAVCWQKHISEAVFYREPVADDGVLYVGDSKKYALAISLDDGRELWRAEIPGGVESASCVSGDLAFFGAGNGELFALERESGKVRWKRKGRQETACSWAPAPAYGALFYNDGSIITGLQLDNGRVFYQSKPGFHLPPHAELTLLPDGFLTATRYGGGVNCLSLKTGELAWRSEGGIIDSLTGIATDGRIAVGAGSGKPDKPGKFASVKAVDLRTQQEMWQCDLEMGGRRKEDQEVHTTPALWDGKVYLGSDSSYLYVLNAANGRMLWKFKADGRVRSAPAICPDDRIVIFGSEDQHVYGVDADNGKLLWRVNVGGNVYAAPFLHEERAYIVTYNGAVCALGAK